MEKRTVLFVDDEEKILSSLKRGLLHEPYNSLFASSGKKALEILERKQVHVIVVDVCMPEMNGLELLRIAKKDYPHIIRMVLSGYTQVTAILTAINEGEVFRFIAKPWKSDEELKTIIRQAIEFYELHSEREMLLHFFEMWIEGSKQELIDFAFLQELVTTRKKHLYEWKKKCDSVPLKSQ